MAGQGYNLPGFNFPLTTQGADLGSSFIAGSAGAPGYGGQMGWSKPSSSITRGTNKLLHKNVQYTVTQNTQILKYLPN